MLSVQTKCPSICLWCSVWADCSCSVSLHSVLNVVHLTSVCLSDTDTSVTSVTSLTSLIACHHSLRSSDRVIVELFLTAFYQWELVWIDEDIIFVLTYLLFSGRQICALGPKPTLISLLSLIRYVFCLQEWLLSDCHSLIRRRWVNGRSLSLLGSVHYTLRFRHVTVGLYNS